MFPDSSSSLDRACDSLTQLNSNLNTCINSLQPRTQAFNQFINITKSYQAYDLVSISEIKSAQYQLSNELEPQIKSLLNQAETGLTQLQKREQLLRTSIDRRLASNSESAVVQASDSTNADDPNQNQLHQLERIRNQKQTLVNELDRLEREVDKKKSLYKTLRDYSDLKRALSILILALDRWTQGVTTES